MVAAIAAMSIDNLAANFWFYKVTERANFRYNKAVSSYDTTCD